MTYTDLMKKVDNELVLSPVGVAYLEKFSIFVNAKFANLNKQNDIEDYREQVEAGEFHDHKCMVIKAIELNDEDYYTFTHSLLTDCPVLECIGGTDSDEDFGDVENWWDMTEEQQALYRKTCYVLVVAVASKDQPTIYVNTEGYEYARYVGI